MERKIFWDIGIIGLKTMDLKIMDIFQWVCCQGYLDMAKDMTEIYPEIDTEISNYAIYIMREACSEGKLNTIKWLCDRYPNISFSCDCLESSCDCLGTLCDCLNIACTGGHLEVCVWLYESYLCIGHNKTIDLMRCFEKACDFERKEIIKWLIEVQSDIVLKCPTISNNVRTLVKLDHMDILEMLVELFPEILQKINCEELFNIACDLCQVAPAKWLKPRCPSFDFSSSIDRVFIDACISNSCLHRDTNSMIEWLLESYMEMGLINEKFVIIFPYLCLCGNLEIVKSLIKMAPNVDITDEMLNEAFQLACRFNNLNSVRMLIENFPNLDIRADNDTAFKIACINISTNINLPKYLAQICPNYVIISDKFQIKYEILDQSI